LVAYGKRETGNKGCRDSANWLHATDTNIIKMSRPLLYHRRVTLLDLFSARLLLEFLGATAALVIVYAALSTVGVIGEFAHFDLVLLGWFMMGWIGSAGGLLIGALTERFESSERFIPPIQYLNIPLSGSFFMVDWLPQWAQAWILLHPLAHCYEVFRAGYFGEAVATHFDLAYFATWAFVMSVAGLVAVSSVRNRVE
jgi:capsular polysaccharide transport system permease protein